MNSTLVFADKTVRRSYTYTLLSTVEFESNESLERYERFKKKLLSACAEGTDSDVQSNRRREQEILRRWLFEGKIIDNCAICGNDFSKDSLVAAHKKPRSECSFNERVDPYVVMPLCKFGCDYLYEIGLIRVCGGTVVSSISGDITDYEKKLVEKLDGNKLDACWVKGRVDYFLKT